MKNNLFSDFSTSTTTLFTENFAGHPNFPLIEDKPIPFLEGYDNI
jgi:hypothetical protein